MISYIKNLIIYGFSGLTGYSYLKYSTPYTNINRMMWNRKGIQLINDKEKSFNTSYKEEQKSIVKKLDALSKEIKELESIYKQKVKDLEELKKSMLQKAFSGELTNK